MMLIHEKWEIKPWQEPSDPYPGSSDESFVFIFFWLFLKAQQHGIHSILVSDSQKSLLLTVSSLHLLVKADKNRCKKKKPKNQKTNIKKTKNTKPFPKCRFAISISSSEMFESFLFKKAALGKMLCMYFFLFPSGI